MNVILILVASLDGKITKGKDVDVTKWSSQEDRTLFERVRDKAKLIVMGSGTYKAAKPEPKRGVLRVVMTHRPQEYTNVAGMLEFTNETPTQLVHRLKDSYDEMLLVGGSQIATQFFKENLIDEFWLTIEPVILGKGTPLVAEVPLDVPLKLLEFRRLNPRGTLHLRYAVNKNAV